MQDVHIKEEFKKLHDSYKKNYGSQRSFRSMRHKKASDGSTVPVFYVGVPGLAVAVSMTFITVLTVAILSTPFKWYVWVPYLIAVFFIFRFAIKYDKVRQIRFMTYSLVAMSMSLMEQAMELEDHEAKREKYDKAKEFLEKASEWVEEPAIAQEIAELERILL